MNNKKITINDSVINEGFTIDATGYNITTGYAVSIYKNLEKQYKKGISFIQLLQYINNNMDILTTGNNYIGGWYNNDNNTYYLDITTVLQDEKEALKLARENNQIAIFNLDTMQDIAVE